MEGSSITDWIQAIGAIASFILSAVGLVYIAITLKEQGRVNEAQFKLLSLERQRYKRESKPVLKVVFAGSVSSPGMTGYNEYTYRIECTNASAFNLCFEYFTLPRNANFSPKLAPYGGAKSGIQRDSYQHVVLQFAVYDGVLPVEMRIHYKDVDGEEYYDDVRIMSPTVHVYSFGKATPHPGGTICSLKDADEYQQVNMYELGTEYFSTKNRRLIPEIVNQRWKLRSVVS